MQKIYYSRQRPKPWIAVFLALGFLLWGLLLALLFTGCTSDGKFARPIVNQPVVSELPDGGTVTNYVPVVSAEWAGALQATEATGGLIPPPVGTWVSLGAAGVGAILAAIARNKQRKADEIAATVIQGIEAMGDETLAGPVKASVARVSTIKGTSVQLHQKVKELTK